MIVVPSHPYGARERRVRYIRDPVPVRLGNLASTLARVSTCAARTDGKTDVHNALSEALHFIEWTGPEVDPGIQSGLVELQVELARRRLRWASGDGMISQDRLSRWAREMSDQVLEWSGLLDE